MVSILTGCRQPVQRGADRAGLAVCAFQSSPAVASRCNGHASCSLNPRRSFNPHRLSPAGATTAHPGNPSSRRVLFQSSPAVASRCNNGAGGGLSVTASCFNPHRLSPAGATRRAASGSFPPNPVSILTGCRQPVQRRQRRLWQSCRLFQSSPAVASRCNDAYGRRDVPGCEVSILTGCRQPVQHPAEFDDLSSEVVSILTGCRQPVQRLNTRKYRWDPLFQSSPAVASRCNKPRRRQPPKRPKFQSSPAVASRCNIPPVITTAVQLAGFNPHRLSPAGATPPAVNEGIFVYVFQSSPAVASRCNIALRGSGSSRR